MLFNYITQKLRFLVGFKNALKKEDNNGQAQNNNESPEQPKLKKNLDENINIFKTFLNDSQDLDVHYLKFGSNKQYLAAIVYFDGLASNTMISDAIVRPMSYWDKDKDLLQTKQDLASILQNEVITAPKTEKENDILKLADSCLNGETIMFIDGYDGGLVINTKGWEKRSVSEPQSESVVRGPREGFTENIRTNSALIRRKIRNENLKLEQITLGRKTKTPIALMYVEGVANPEIIKEVKYRINSLDVESILESGYIEEYIEDAPFSPFATIDYSEKPDTIAGRILEGRIAILVDGTPFVLTVPMVFIESFQSSEDYYLRSAYASFLRFTRFLAFALSIFAPSIYIALTAFHHELIPTTLLFTFVKARQGTPFPVFIEALIMLFAFEVLREGGLRLPQPVGQAISIVGALVMGDAAVSAGLVGAPLVITIAITAVASFLVPTQNEAISLLRLFVMVPSAILGFYGIAFALLAIMIHLASLESFGVPYYEAFSKSDDSTDTVIRLPLWAMRKRPKDIAHKDIRRGNFFIPPLRPFSAERDEIDSDSE